MAQRRAAKKPIFLSLRAELLIGFSIVFAVVFAIAFIWFYNYTTQMALSRIKEDAVQTMKSAVAGVSIDEFVSLVKEVPAVESGYPNDIRYWNHVNWLGTVHNIEPRAFLYTWVKDPNQAGYVYFVGSNGALEPPPRGGATYLYHYKASEAMLNGLQETTYRNNFKPYQDQWGAWGLTIYTPLKDRNGESVGGLGIDFKADYIATVQQGIRTNVFEAFAITYLSLFILIWFLSSQLTHPIVLLTRMSVHVGEGLYEQDFTSLSKGWVHDEINILASNFADMVGKVYQREKNLQRQVDILKIEIDENKRRLQVAEIIETEFFKELQIRAENMRARKQYIEETGQFRKITPDEIEALLKRSKS